MMDHLFYIMTEVLGYYMNGVPLPALLTREQSFRTRSRSGTQKGAKFAAQAFIDISLFPCYDRPNSTQAMRRRVCVQDWQRELRMVKAVQKRAQKMAFEPPSRIMKLAGTARYSSRVFMARPAYL